MAEKKEKVIDMQEAREAGEVAEEKKEGFFKRAYNSTKAFVGDHWKAGLAILGAGAALGAGIVMMNSNNNDEFEFDEISNDDLNLLSLDSDSNDDAETEADVTE